MLPTGSPKDVTTEPTRLLSRTQAANGLSARRDGLTYLAELAEPPPGDPLRTGLLLPRLLVRITLLISLTRIAADASPARTKPQNPRFKADIKRSSRNRKVSERMVGTVQEAEGAHLLR